MVKYRADDDNGFQAEIITNGVSTLHGYGDSDIATKWQPKAATYPVHPAPPLPPLPTYQPNPSVGQYEVHENHNDEQHYDDEDAEQDGEHEDDDDDYENYASVENDGEAANKEDDGEVHDVASYETHSEDYSEEN